ncbi:MAG: pilus assembly protein TadG-related protein [Pseudomonadota bacterium]|nr:pilus assembly protein TadG-related protein [Pseudomonadota bacterium]
MAAGAMMMLALLAFAAVEFQRYTTVRNNLQNALDAAALAVARSADSDAAKKQELGMAVLSSGLGSGDWFAIKSANFIEADGEVTADAAVTVSPIISNLFGATDISASARSKASRLGQKLEVALVLDNTYSMLTNDRLGITKTAATNFVDTLAAHAAQTRVADAVKISLVPYSTTVNVGPAYKGAPWMDVNAVSPIHDDLFDAPVNRFSLFNALGVAWAGCVESRPYPHDVRDTAPTSTDPSSLFVPYFGPDEPDEPGDTPPWTNTYAYTNNYLPDDLPRRANWFTRQSNAAKYDRAPTPSTWTQNGYSRGPNYGCKLQPIVRLTTDMAAVKAGIDGMTATGDTYSNFGMMWGWHTLSPRAPFADGVAYGGDVRKIAVLMTDGQNASWNNGSPNQSLYSGAGYIWQGRYGITSGTADERRAALDRRMVEVCRNMKAQGIVVYTVRVEVTEGSPQALQDCATDPGKFFDVKAAAELDATFQAIAASLLNLRISS